jgi:holo-[acyl-carrier protein] synthase
MSPLAGVGVDAVDLERFRAVLGRRPLVGDRIFSDREREDAARRRDPVPSLAVRFAAKEAVLKALGVGLGAVGLQEIEVVRLRSGAPEIELHGRAAALARQQGANRWHVSLTHSDLVAVATVVAEDLDQARGG